MLGGQGQFHIRATATYSLTSNHRVLAEPEVPVPETFRGSGWKSGFQ